MKGCFSEPPAAGCTNSLRALPYNVPGCFVGDPNPKSTEKAPSPPPCDPLEESNAYCAQACIDWAPRIPEIGSSWATFYVATQAGYACFCGAEEHAQRYLTEANKVADAECNAPCGCTGPCPPVTSSTGSGPSPAGKAGEMCGGGWRNTTMRVSCGFQWGAYFLITFTLSCALYLVAGIYGPLARGSTQGLTAKQSLTVHPHYHQWVEVVGLAADGAAYVKARQAGKATPLASHHHRQQQQQHREQRDGSNYRTQGSSGEERGARQRKEHQKEKRSSSKSKSRSSTGEGPDLEQSLVGPAGQSGLLTASSEASAGAAAAAAGTAAGGGGRWVHIPN